jgi:NAD-dependent DNA ligase
MKFLKRDIAALKKLVLAAKDAYYNKAKNLRIKLSEYSPEVATALKMGKLHRGAVPVLPDVAIIDKGMLELTDDRYDLLEKIIEANDPTWKPISGAKPVVGKVKTKLPYAMSSLGKSYPGDGKLDIFAKKNTGPWVVSDKLDGNALEVVYTKGATPKAYTKTSPTIGQDVSFLVPHMNIPQQLNENIAVRFETILPKSVFLAKHGRDSGNAKNYKNARNMVAGVFNTKGVHKALPDVKILAHEIMNSALSPSAQLAKLKKLGFDVVPHTVVGRLSDSVLSTMLAKRKTASKYMIDGLVINQDKPHRASLTGEDPSYAIAFKINDETENLVQTKVEYVEWNASKHGSAKPRIKIEPVELAGATVDWATGHNGFFIVHGYSYKDRKKYEGKPDRPIGPGAIVEVTRSGEVIPYITRVVKPARKPDLPKVPFTWNANEVDILIKEAGNPVVAVKRIYAFLSSGLGVEHLAIATIRKCYDGGMTKIKDFLLAKPVTFLKFEGIKEVSANKYYQQIQSKLKEANLANVAAHSGFFGRNFGTKRMQMIIDKHDLFKLATKLEGNIVDIVESIDGFSSVTAEQFAAGLPKFIKWVDTLPITFKKPEKVVVKSATMKDQAICFTGFRNVELENAIVRHGGTIASGVNAKTTALVVKDKSSASSKATKAKELGIPIYTSEELLKKYLNLLF